MWKVDLSNLTGDKNYNCSSDFYALQRLFIRKQSIRDNSSNFQEIIASSIYSSAFFGVVFTKVSYGLAKKNNYSPITKA